MNRRSFIHTTGLSAAALSLGQPLWANGSATNRNFKISLKADAIGVRLGMRKLMDAASRIGFEALAVPSEWLIELPGGELSSLQYEMQERDLAYGSAGLPVQFRETKERFQKDLAALPRHAKAMQKAGITRVGTWIMPSHANLTYEENMDLHVTRLRDCAKVMNDHGVRLGLEYVGTKTLHDAAAYGFIRTGRQLKQLIEAADVNGLGVVLDSFHWYTSGESLEQLDIWTNKDIVAVDLNDADRTLSAAAQIDGNRELPGATGKIDVAAFVGFLKKVGYDGPVRAEPFNATLEAMQDELAMQATFNALRKASE